MDGVWENTARRIQVSRQCRHFHGRLHLSCSGSHAALTAHNTQRTGLNFQMTKKKSGRRGVEIWLFESAICISIYSWLKRLPRCIGRGKKKIFWIARLSHHLTLFTLNGAGGFQIPQNYLVFSQFRTSAVVILSKYKSRLQTVSAVQPGKSIRERKGGTLWMTSTARALLCEGAKGPVVSRWCFGNFCANNCFGQPPLWLDRSWPWITD